MLRLNRCFVAVLLVATAILSATSWAGDSGGLNFQDALDREGVRIENILDDDFATRIEPVNVDPYLEWKERLGEATGFEYSTYYALMGHFGTNRGSSSENLNGQLHTINAWTPHQNCQDAGSLVFYYMTIGQYTDTTAGQLSNNLGLTTGINDSAAVIDFFRFVGWYQPLLDDDIELYTGQFLLRDLYDLGDYASDDTRNFVSQIMSANPSETLPVPGLGMAAKFRLTENWTVGGGFTDANARVGDLWNFDTFSKGDYASMGYLNYTENVCGVGQANYQLNLFSVDATQNGGYSRGLSVILEQGIGDEHATFFKYNRADKRVGDTRQSIAAGVLRKGIFIWEDDLLGFGGGWGDPTSRDRRSEYVLETFWRAQLAPGVQITPNVQLWLDPSQTPGKDTQAAFTIRAVFDI